MDTYIKTEKNSLGGIDLIKEITLQPEFKIENGGIRKKNSRVAIKLPSYYNETLAALIEGLKVEGYWNFERNEFSICNSNSLLIKRFEELLKELGIFANKRLTVRINIKENIKRQNIEVFCEKEKVKFHIQTTKIKNTIVRKISFNLPYQKRNAIVKINGKSYNVKIQMSNKIMALSPLNSFAYVEIRFRNSTFNYILKKIFKENSGTYKIRVSPLLYNSIPHIVMSAFGMLVDCEGSLDYYGAFRKIRVRMRNKQYLEDWINLLKKVGVDSAYSGDGLVVQGHEDFKTLASLGFKLYHSEKVKKFENILNSYKVKQISRGTAESFYLKKLKELNGATATELAAHTKKSKRTVNHYLNKLKQANKMIIDKKENILFYKPKMEDRGCPD